MKYVKISAISVGVVLMAVVMGLGAAKAVMDARYFDGYDPKAALDAEVADVQERDGYQRLALSFKGWRNERVPTLLLLPKTDGGRVPCIIFLHGIGQNKDFIEEESDGFMVAKPFLDAGFAFVSFDQYTRGERRKRGQSWWQEFKAFRLRPAYTVNDTRRLIDYLETRPEIEHDRIYLVGASYGAITGSAAAAFDKRVRAVVLCYGGGHIRRLVQSAAIMEGVRQLRLPMWLVQLVSWYFLSVADPVKYVGDISPRPVFLQNGTQDSLIAPDAARALQEAAREPKMVRWYEGDHIGFDQRTVIVVLMDILAYLKGLDASVGGAVGATMGASPRGSVGGVYAGRVRTGL